MKAIVRDRYGPPDILELREVDPPEPGEGEVLVEVRAASVNPYDWHFLRGEPYFMRVQAGLRKPKMTVLGADIAGVVEKVGPNVSGYGPGDEVFCEDGTGGGFAEFATVSEDLLQQKPANLSFEHAATVPLAGLTALQALRDHGRLEAGAAGSDHRSVGWCRHVCGPDREVTRRPCDRRLQHPQYRAGPLDRRRRGDRLHARGVHRGGDPLRPDPSACWYGRARRMPPRSRAQRRVATRSGDRRGAGSGRSAGSSRRWRSRRS